MSYAYLVKVRDFLRASASYVRKNPEEIVKVAVNAAGLRFGVPIAALRWAADQLPAGKKTPTDIEIGSTPPALRVGATINAMGTGVRASAAIKIDEVSIDQDSILIGVRLKDVTLKLALDSDSPIATLIKSGALDLSKPGNVVKVLPKKPEAIISAEDDRIVLDLMKIPKIASNKRLRRILAAVTPVFNVGSVETDDDHVYVRFKATPRGLPQTIEALRNKDK